jgi:uncharacterized membrane protein
VLRSAGLKAIHDEAAEFEHQTSAAAAGPTQSRFGLDSFAVAVTLKAVFLEGVEVVFIVLTFGISADDVPAAVAAAAAAGVLVVILGVALHRPLVAVPENILKYGVSLLLVSFGTFWAFEGLGFARGGGESLAWPGSDLAIPVLLVAWFLLSRVLIAALPRLRSRPKRSGEVREGVGA